MTDKKKFFYEENGKPKFYQIRKFRDIAVVKIEGGNDENKAEWLDGSFRILFLEEGGDKYVTAPDGSLDLITRDERDEYYYFVLVRPRIAIPYTLFAPLPLADEDLQKKLIKDEEHLYLNVQNIVRFNFKTDRFEIIDMEKTKAEVLSFDTGEV